MRPSDIDEIFELVQLAFGDAWPGFPISVSRREHLEWKIRYPDQRPDLCDVLEMDGRIVGYIEGREWDVLVQGERYLDGFRGDYCIHPDYQERGLTSPWSDWLDERRETEPRPISLSEDSTHPRLMRRSRRLDNRDLLANKVDRLTLHFDAMALVRLGTGEPGRVTPGSLLRAARAAALIAVGRARWRRPSTPLPELGIRTVESFDEQADRLWERAKGVVRLRQGPRP